MDRFPVSRRDPRVITFMVARAISIVLRGAMSIAFRMNFTLFKGRTNTTASRSIRIIIDRLQDSPFVFTAIMTINKTINQYYVQRFTNRGRSH